MCDFIVALCFECGLFLPIKSLMPKVCDYIKKKKKMRASPDLTMSQPCFTDKTDLRSSTNTDTTVSGWRIGQLCDELILLENLLREGKSNSHDKL